MATQKYTTEDRTIQEISDVISQLQIAITKCSQAKQEIRDAGKHHKTTASLTSILGNHSADISGMLNEAADQLTAIIGLTTTGSVDFELAPALVIGCPPDLSSLKFSEQTDGEIKVESNSTARMDASTTPIGPTGPAHYVTSGSKPLTSLFAANDVIFFERSSMADDDGKGQTGFAYTIASVENGNNQDGLITDEIAHDYNIATGTHKWDYNFIVRKLYDAVV
jgi:hypothetical protein